MVLGNLDTTQVIQLIILLLYFIGLLGVGYLTMRMDASMEEYLLADRGLGAWLAGISSSASSESGWVTLGAVGMGYALGSSAAWFIPGCLLGYCVNWYFIAPRLREISRERSLITLPDFLEDRVNDRSRMIRILSVLIIFVAMTAYIGAQFKASGKLFAGLFFENESVGQTTGILAGAGITILYTMFGGFRASSWTDLIQGVVIALGLSLFPVYLLVQMGGIASLHRALKQEPARGWMEYEVTYLPEQGDPVEKTLRIDSYQQKQTLKIRSSSISTSDDDGSYRAETNLKRRSSDVQFAVEVQSNTTQRHRSTTDFSYALSLPPDTTRVASFRRNRAPPLPVSGDDGKGHNIEETVSLETDRTYVINRRIRIRPTTVETLNAGEDLVDPFGATNNPSRGQNGAQNEGPLFPISSSLGFVLGLLGIGLGYPGMPHVLSRFMATRNQTQISRARVIALFWASIAFYGAVVIGMMARVQLPPELIQDQENAFPVLATHILHPVVSGVLVSAILAAIMSTADSMMIVASSAVSRDLYQQIYHPESSQHKLVLISRATVFILGILGILAALLNVQLIFWFVLVAWAILGASFGPPVLLGLWWKGLSKWGVLAGMGTGATTAIVWKQFPVLSQTLFGYDIYQLIPAFVVSMAVTWGVSLLTTPPAEINKRMSQTTS